MNKLSGSVFCRHGSVESDGSEVHVFAVPHVSHSYELHQHRRTVPGSPVPDDLFWNAFCKTAAEIHGDSQLHRLCGLPDRTVSASTGNFRVPAKPDLLPIRPAVHHPQVPIEIQT